MSLVDDLVNEVNGKVISVTGADSGQCTAVPHYWEQKLGLGIVYGNAKDTYANASDSNYIKALNGPSNFPEAGAVIVYGANWGGGYGHTGVALAGCDANTLIILEQNNPIGHAVTISKRDYSGVYGWFYPRVLQAVPASSDVDIPTADNEGVVNGEGLHAHSQPSTEAPWPWWYSNNEHVTLLTKTQGENVTTGPYAPSAWWYQTDKGWVSDAYIRTTKNPANVPDYVAPSAPTPAPVNKPIGRVIYDSTTATDIPADAPVVAGYVDGKYKWSDNDWARFSTPDKIRIAISAQTNDGIVLDVETGDATPQEALDWVKMRRAQAVNPVCYVNRTNQQAVKGVFAAADEPEPLYWVATLDGTKVDLAGNVVACQYAGESLSGSHYDLSTVTDSWPQSSTSIAKPTEAPTPTPPTPVSYPVDNPSTSTAKPPVAQNIKKAWLQKLIDWIEGLFK